MPRTGPTPAVSPFVVKIPEPPFSPSAAVRPTGQTSGGALMWGRSCWQPCRQTVASAPCDTAWRVVDSLVSSAGYLRKRSIFSTPLRARREENPQQGSGLTLESRRSRDRRTPTLAHPFIGKETKKFLTSCIPINALPRPRRDVRRRRAPSDRKRASRCPRASTRNASRVPGGPLPAGVAKRVDSRALCD